MSISRATLVSSAVKTFLQPLERPLGMLAQKVVVPGCVLCERRPVLGPARVAESDERVPSQVAPVVPRHVEPLVALAKLLAPALEPVDERDCGLGLGRERLVRAAPFDPAVPGADVLADVTAVDAVAERAPVLVGDGLARLRPVREAAGGVERARLVESVGGTRLDAER